MLNKKSFTAIALILCIFSGSVLVSCSNGNNKTTEDTTTTVTPTPDTSAAADTAITDTASGRPIVNPH